MVRGQTFLHLRLAWSGNLSATDELFRVGRCVQCELPDHSRSHLLCWQKCLPIKFLRNKTGKFLPETIAVRGIKPVTGKNYLILKMGSLNNKSGNQIRIILDTM